MWQAVDKPAVGARADEDQSESAGKIFTLESDMPPEAWLAATAKRRITVAVSKPRPNGKTTRTCRRAEPLNSTQGDQRKRNQSERVRTTGFLEASEGIEPPYKDLQSSA